MAPDDPNPPAETSELPLSLQLRGAFRRYEVIRLIGVGGVGLVYEAREKATGQRVAIKVLRPELASSAFAAHLFWREARHLRRLAHPRVLPVCEISESHQGPFLVTPFMERGSLAGALGSGKPLPIALTLRWVQHIGEALAHAHRHGVIHGDVKPANVLLNGEGDVFLADFGFARAALNDSLIELPGAIGAGTRPYLSPAVAAGEVEDTRRDIFALGVLFYQMLTGHLPKPGEAHSTPEILRLNPEASAGLGAIALAAMAPAQRDRYANADDLLEDLRRVEGGGEPLGPHGPPTSSWSRQLARARAILGIEPRSVRRLLGAAALLAITVGSLVSVPRGLGPRLTGAAQLATAGARVSRGARPASELITRGWGKAGYDLAATYYYPWTSKVNVGTSPFTNSWSSPRGVNHVLTGDVNGDGRLELVFNDETNTFLYSGSGERLGVIKGTGQLGLVADADGDGRPEILTFINSEGMLVIRAFDAGGNLRKAYMMGGQKLPYSSVVTLQGVVDLDGDGQNELILIANAGYPSSRADSLSRTDAATQPKVAPEAEQVWFRRVVLFNAATGRQLGFYDTGPFASPPVSISDLNRDGRLDVVFGCEAPRNNKTGMDGSKDGDSYVWALDGRTISSWRDRFDADTGREGLASQMRMALLWRYGPLNTNGFFDTSVIVADLSNHLVPEVVVTAFCHRGQEMGRLLVLSPADGRPVAGFQRDFGAFDVRLAAVADLNPGGHKEILVCSKAAHKLWAVESTSGLGIWRVFDGGDVAPGVVAVNDVNGDGFLEIILALGHRLCVLSHDLNLLWEWSRPDRASLNHYTGAVGDVDGDGINEIIVVSGNSAADVRADILHAPKP